MLPSIYRLAELQRQGHTRQLLVVKLGTSPRQNSYDKLKEE